MSYSIRSLEKYVADNPDLFPDANEVLSQARASLQPGSKIIAGGFMEALIGADRIGQFEFDVMIDPEHHRMWREDLDPNGPPPWDGDLTADPGDPLLIVLIRPHFETDSIDPCNN